MGPEKARCLRELTGTQPYPDTSGSDLRAGVWASVASVPISLPPAPGARSLALCSLTPLQASSALLEAYKYLHSGKPLFSQLKKAGGGGVKKLFFASTPGRCAGDPLLSRWLLPLLSPCLGVPERPAWQASCPPRACCGCHAVFLEPSGCVWLLALPRGPWISPGAAQTRALPAGPALSSETTDCPRFPSPAQLHLSAWRRFSWGPWVT